MRDVLPTANLILYKAANGYLKLQVLLKKETIWQTQNMMAKLFAVGVPALN